MTTLPASLQAIRRRLMWILLRSFGTVVLLLVVLMLASVAQQLSSATRRNPFYRSPLASILETYYLGRGNWEGVAALVRANAVFEREWARATLVDNEGRIVLRRGRTDVPGVGEPYRPQPGDSQVTLFSAGQRAGILYMERALAPHPWPFIFGLLSSVGTIAVFLGLLTLMIGMLLMRRFVNPLAEIIAASQAVAAGDFSTRVSLHTHTDDLSTLAEHFNAMAETLERNEQERRALFSDIAHELRTPLTILKGRLEGILDGIYPADEEHIAIALEETYLLERLVEDLRLLALAEARQLPFEKKPLQVQEVIEHVLNLFKPQAAEREISLHFHAEPVPSLSLDPQRLEQIIGNILDNAIRYGPSGGKVEINLQQIRDEVEITISDNGPGVPEEDLPWIFNRFWRGDKSRSRHGGGTGLGLAIAKQLVEGQGGQISAHNLPTGGLQIRLTFPIT